MSCVFLLWILTRIRRSGRRYGASVRRRLDRQAERRVRAGRRTAWAPAQGGEAEGLPQDYGREAREPEVVISPESTSDRDGGSGGEESVRAFGSEKEEGDSPASAARFDPDFVGQPGRRGSPSEDDLSDIMATLDDDAAVPSRGRILPRRLPLRPAISAPSARAAAWLATSAEPAWRAEMLQLLENRFGHQQLPGALSPHGSQTGSSGAKQRAEYGSRGGARGGDSDRVSDVPLPPGWSHGTAGEDRRRAIRARRVEALRAAALELSARVEMLAVAAAKRGVGDDNGCLDDTGGASTERIGVAGMEVVISGGLPVLESSLSTSAVGNLRTPASNNSTDDSSTAPLSAAASAAAATIMTSGFISAGARDDASCSSASPSHSSGSPRQSAIDRQAISESRQRWHSKGDTSDIEATVGLHQSGGKAEKSHVPRRVVPDKDSSSSSSSPAKRNPSKGTFWSAGVGRRGIGDGSGSDSHEDSKGSETSAEVECLPPPNEANKNAGSAARTPTDMAAASTRANRHGDSWLSQALGPQASATASAAASVAAAVALRTHDFTGRLRWEPAGGHLGEGGWPSAPFGPSDGALDSEEDDGNAAASAAAIEDPFSLSNMLKELKSREQRQAEAVSAATARLATAAEIANAEALGLTGHHSRDESREDVGISHGDLDPETRATSGEAAAAATLRRAIGGILSPQEVADLITRAENVLGGGGGGSSNTHVDVVYDLQEAESAVTVPDPPVEIRTGLISSRTGVREETGVQAMDAAPPSPSAFPGPLAAAVTASVASAASDHAPDEFLGVNTRPGLPLSTANLQAESPDVQQGASATEGIEVISGVAAGREVPPPIIHSGILPDAGQRFGGPGPRQRLAPVELQARLLAEVRISSDCTLTRFT